MEYNLQEDGQCHKNISPDDEQDTNKSVNPSDVLCGCARAITELSCPFNCLVIFCSVTLTISIILDSPEKAKKQYNASSFRKLSYSIKFLEPV